MSYRTAPVLFIATTVAVGIGLAMLLPPVIEEFNTPYENKEKSVETLLTLAAEVSLGANRPGELQAYVDEIVQTPEVLKVVVSDSNNEVVARSWNKNNTEQTAIALASSDHAYWRSLDVIVGGRTLGNISVQFTQRDWRNSMQRLASLGVVVFGGGLLLVLLSGWTSSSLLNRKLSLLSTAVKEVTRGNFNVRVQLSDNDEVGLLGRSFDAMVQELGRSTRRLRESEERFELAVQGTDDGIWDWNTESNALYLSPRFKQILGYNEQELPGLFNVWLGLLHPDDRERIDQQLKSHLEHQTPFQSEFRMRTKSGQWRWILGRGQAVRTEGGIAKRMVGSHTDITYRKRAEHTLFREKERLLVTLQSIGDGVITADMEGCVEYLNPTACKMTGWDIGQAHGVPLAEVFTVVNERRGSKLPDLIKLIATRGRPLQLRDNTVLVSMVGERFNIELAASPLKDQKGQMTGVVAVFHDTTEHRKLMSELSHQATHDPLTDLINRYEFEKRLDQALVSAKEEGAQHVLCYMDLDQFKIINDTSGHAAGDEMLRQISKVLHAQFRTQDTLARLGGDEFGLLLENCPLDKALEITDKARQAVNEFRFTWQDRNFNVGVSIGVVEINDRPVTAADVLSTVDQACYIAKHKGRNRIHVFQEDDSDSSRWSGDVQWATKLQDALDENRFVLFAQPIVPLDPDEDYRHYEILLRLKDKKGKIIAPGAFLPAAERYGMMPLVDRWVVRNTLEALSTAWQGRKLAPINTVAINLSGGLLGDESFLDFVKEALNEYSLPPKLLCFEITETVAIANFTQAETFIRELRELGCRFSLDDFGSGFASFSYLKTLPVDYLKIDGSFVRHMDKDPVDYAMVDVINRIGQVMNLKTIAEFVENEDILDGLKTLGVNYAQGYHLGKPQPLYEVMYGD